MNKMTAFAAALAAVLSTSAVFAGEGDQAEVFASLEGNNGVDPAVTASINPGSTGEEAKDEAKAPQAIAGRQQSPALSAVERSTGRKMKALPGVKKLDVAPEAAKPEGKAAGKAVAAGGKKYASIIHRYASTYGVPVSLAHAVISVESNYRESARGRAGEIGLMQIKPATARMMGYSGSTKGLFDPETNIRYGIKYLAKAKSLSDGSTCGTILKYNAGHGAKRMNPISAAYCAKVKRILGDA